MCCREPTCIILKQAREKEISFGLDYQLSSSRDKRGDVTFPAVAALLETPS